MHLQADEPAVIQGIDEAGGGKAVDPCPHDMTDVFDADMIVLPDLEGALNGVIQGYGIQPVPSSFIINTTGPSPGGGIDVAL